MPMLYKEDYANSENYTCTLSYCKALFWDTDYVGIIECSRNFWLGRTIYESIFFFKKGSASATKLAFLFIFIRNFYC